MAERDRAGPTPNCFSTLLHGPQADPCVSVFDEAHQLMYGARASTGEVMRDCKDEAPAQKMEDHVLEISRAAPACVAVYAYFYDTRYEKTRLFCRRETGFFVSPTCVITTYHLLTPSSEHMALDKIAIITKTSLQDLTDEDFIPATLISQREHFWKFLDHDLSYGGAEWPIVNDLAVLSTEYVHSHYLLPYPKLQLPSKFVCALGYPEKMGNKAHIRTAFTRQFVKRVKDDEAFEAIVSEPNKPLPSLDDAAYSNQGQGESDDEDDEDEDEEEEKGASQSGKKRKRDQAPGPKKLVAKLSHMLRRIYFHYDRMVAAAGSAVALNAAVEEQDSGNSVHRPWIAPSVAFVTCAMTTGMAGGPVVLAEQPNYFIGMAWGCTPNNRVNDILSVFHPAFVYIYRKFVVPTLPLDSAAASSSTPSSSASVPTTEDDAEGEFDDAEEEAKLNSMPAPEWVKGYVEEFQRGVAALKKIKRAAILASKERERAQKAKLIVDIEDKKKKKANDDVERIGGSSKRIALRRALREQRKGKKKQIAYEKREQARLKAEKEAAGEAMEQDNDAPVTKKPRRSKLSRMLINTEALTGNSNKKQASKKK